MHDFCPHFEIGPDNLVSCQSSGDFLRTRDTNVVERSSDDAMSSASPDSSHWTAIVWFAGYPLCVHEARQKQYRANDFHMFQDDFNLLWADKCVQSCDFVLVRPQPPRSDFLFEHQVKHFLIWRRQLFSFRAVLIKSGCLDGRSQDVVNPYQACGVTRSDSVRFCETLSGQSDAKTFATLRGRTAFCTVRHGAFLQSGRVSCSQLERATEPEGRDGDMSSLMQVGPPIEDAIGRHIRLNVPNHRNTRIMVWFHPVDARGRMSRLFRFDDYNHELPAGPQVRSFWASTVGRRQCFVYPVQPIPTSVPERVPHFILTTFQVGTIYPVLLDYRSETEQIRATFLLYFAGYPDVNGIFRQVYPMNQCVWLNDCIVQMDNGPGLHSYEWGEVVPIFRGAYIILTESTRPSEGSGSTCSSDDNGNSDGSDTDGSFRSGHYAADVYRDEADDSIFMQSSISPRGNTATLDEHGIELQEHFLDGVLARMSLLHLEDAVANYVYRTFQRPLNELRVVQTWVVSYVHLLGYVPRFLKPEAGRSLTEDILVLWQDLAPGEDIGFSSERYPTFRSVDQRVVSLLGAPMSKLRLGYRAYLVTGWPDPIPSTVAMLSNGKETADAIIRRAGYGSRCEDRFCILYQDRGGLNPVWKGEDIVSEVHGSHFSILLQHDDECHWRQMPSAHAVQRHPEPVQDDSFSSMQIEWQTAFAAEEPEIRHQLGLRPLDLEQHILWPHHGQILVRFSDARQTDVIRVYLLALKPMHHFPVHSVTTWMGTETVVLTPRLCAYTEGSSFTRAFLQEWQDFEEEEPFTVALVHPEVPPLSLKVSSLNLMSLTRMQSRANKRLYLFDILFRGIPRRSAVLAMKGDTLFMLVQKLGISHLCGPERYWCVLQQYDNDKEWGLFDVIEEPHATSFKLLFREFTSLSCSKGSRSQEASSDQTSLMQRMTELQMPLKRYAQQFFSTSGTLTFWVHRDSDHLVQWHSAICSFSHVNEIHRLCSEIWDSQWRPDGYQIVPIEPAPVFIALPRPHVLAIGGRLRWRVPVLCRVREFVRYNLLSLMAPSHTQQTKVASLFQMAVPQNDCTYGSLCYALYREERYLFWQEIQLQSGAYVQLFEDERRDSPSETTCPVETPYASSLESDQWSNRFSLDDENDRSYEWSASEHSQVTSEEDSLNLMQRPQHAEDDQSEEPSTLSTRRADTESLCDGYASGGPIELAPHFTNQYQQIEDLRVWLIDLLSGQDAITLFVFEGRGVDVVTHQLVFTRDGLHAREGFVLWLRRELRPLWQGSARIFPLQAAPFVDLRIAVLLPRAYGRELPVLLEIRHDQETWREIHVATQAMTVNSFVWRSSLPPLVPESMQYHVMLSGEEASPGDLVPWEPGQWLSITVGQLAVLGGEVTTASAADPQIPSLSSLGISLSTSWASSRRSAGASCSSQPPEGLQNEDFEGDITTLFQTEVFTRSHEWIRRPVNFLDRHETLHQELDSFLAWRRKVDQTRRTTLFHQYETFSMETIAFWGAMGRWPDFVLYTTKDDRVSHWGLAVDEFFVLERFDFATVIRDYLRGTIPFSTKVMLVPVKPLPDVFEQNGEDDLFLLVDEEPEEDAIPVFVSLWIREGDRPPELYAQRLPRSVRSSVLLQSYGLEEVCAHQLYVCLVSHFGQELPRLVSWNPFHGMKIDIRVEVLGLDHCEDPIPENDEIGFFQTEWGNVGGLHHSESVDLLSIMQTERSIRQVPRASDLDPFLPLRSVHTWHGSFLLPNPIRDQVRIGVRMIMPGSLEALSSFDFRCWGITSSNSLTTLERSVYLRQERWDEQFFQAALDMGLQPPVRLILVASQPPPTEVRHMLALNDDLFHSGNRFFLIHWPVRQTTSFAVLSCPELCLYDYIERFLGLDDECKHRICILHCQVPRGTSTFVSGQEVTMPTGTFCHFTFPEPSEVACVSFTGTVELSLLQTAIHVSPEVKPNEVIRSPTSGLPPPGNPEFDQTEVVVWSSTDFHKLDDWVFEAQLLRIVDFPVQMITLDGLHSPTQKQNRPTLTLADKLYDCEVPMPDFMPLWNSLKAPWEKVEIRWSPIIDRLSDDLQSLAARLLLEKPEVLESIEIYTDGSFSTGDGNQHAGWSFFIVGKFDTETVIVDYDWGLVATDPMESTWTGAEVSNAKSAEITALIRALEWLFAHPQKCECRLLFDSQLAGYSGSGDYNISPLDRHLRLLRALASAYEVFNAKSLVSWEHVKGHTGNLGNEIADSLAKQAFQSQTELRWRSRPDYTPYIFGHRFPIEYFWLFFQHLTNDRMLIQNQVLRLPGAHIGGTVSERLPAALVAQPRHEPTYKIWQLFLATYNVLTLGPKTGGIFVQYLREQVSSHGLDILFLQETRTRREQLVVSESHLRYTAAAHEGVGGIEIWLARVHARTGKPLFLKTETQVFHASPQIMLLKTAIHGTELLLLTFHAPHSGKDKAVIQNFWQQLTDLVTPFYQKYPNLIVGADANAHFDTALEGHIGDAGLEHATDIGGQCFKRFLMMLDLFVPSTYEHIHCGDHHTWWSFAANKGARCDYFAVPKAWEQAHFETQVRTSLDEGKAAIDHLPLTMFCKVPFLSRKRNTPVYAFDRRAIQNATKEQLLNILQGIEIPDWHIGIDQHMLKLTQQIADRLCNAFPQKHGPRRSYISDATWSIRAARMKMRRQTSCLRQTLACLSLQEAFRCLKNRCPANFRQLFCNGLCIGRQIWKLQRRTAASSKDLKTSLRADRTAALERLATSEPQMSQRDFAQALQALGVRNAKKPCGIQPLPMLVDKQGNTVDSFESLLTCWREYFGEQEDGTEVSLEDLLQQSDRRWANASEVPPWDFLPTLYQLERQFRKCKPGKAFFLDGIPGELLHKIPAFLAARFFSLFCKQVAFMREPVLFKGGFLTPAFKKGSPKFVQNYRSLFVSSVVGKSLHSIYRQDLVRCFEKQRMQLQVGGIPGQGTTQPVHALRLHQLHAIRKGKSSAIVFVDISNAFYRLLRQHIMPIKGEERSVRQLFESLCLPQECYTEFCDLMQQPSAIEAAEVPLHLKALFQEFFESTWFKLRDDPHIVHTRRGSRPGDSFADLCFSFALAKIVGRTVRVITAEFPDLCIAWSGKKDPFCARDVAHVLDPVMPVWADDLALAFDDVTAEGLLQKCERIVALLFDCLQQAGLKPNLKPGKSEVLLDLRGKGALSCRRQLVFQGHKLTIPSAISSFAISVVGAYRHLGTWIQVGAGIARELKVKFAIAHDAITKYRSQIFANRAMTIAKKRQFFHSLVLSVVGYNAAVWVPRNRRQTAQIESAFHRLYQRLAVLHFGAPALTWSRAWLLYKLGLPEASMVLTVSRLRYLGQLLHAGQPILWALLRRDEQWKVQLQNDLAVLHNYCPEAGIFVPLRERWTEMVEFISSSPARWKRTLRKLQARTVSMQQLDMEWNRWHQEIYDCLVENGIVETGPGAIHASTYCCLLCAKVFKTKANMAVHAFKKHGRINKARAFVSGTQCEACLKQYELHSDLINHVKRGGPCYAFYQQRGTRVQPQPAVNSRVELKEKSLFRLPFMQAEGPKCRASDVRLIGPDDEVLRLHLEWSQCLRELDHEEPLLERLRRATCTTYLYMEEILDAFDQWVVQLGERILLHELSAFAAFKQKASVEWFLANMQNSSACHDSVQNFFRREAGGLTSFVVPIPQTLSYSPKVFAHFFSGARRKGDFQEHIERLQATAISVDIIFDVTWGNLLQPATFELFVRAMKEGILCGFLSGPPCETWSRARAFDDSGPRILRDRSRLQGICSLTRRESEQVSIGNQLLGVTLRFFLFALIFNAVAILEHPACPEDRPDLPSIWWLDVINCLLRFEGCVKLRIYQGLYGGLSPKPTDLLFANCGSYDQLVRFFVAARTTPMPKSGRIGKEADGTWRTSILKEYPDALCRAFAELFLSRCQSTVSEQNVPPWFEEAIALLKADFNEEATRGPDCCRATTLAAPNL